MKRQDLRLLPLAVSAWAAALVCVLLPWAVWPCAALAGAAAVALLAGAAGRRNDGAVFRGGLAAVMLATASGVALTVGFAMPPRDAVAAEGGRIVEVIADVSSSASIGRDGRLWFDAQTVRAGPPERTSARSAPVRIGVEPAPGFDLGARIRVVGQGLATHAGERAALVVFAERAEIVHPAAGVFGLAADVRRAFVERATRLPEPGAGLLPGLAVGDTRAVSLALGDDMRTSGLSHLTAVSGANCAIVVGAVFWLVALCGGGRGARVAVSLAALAGFVVLVAPEPSVIRASVMAGFAMLTVLLGRPRAGIGVLAVCVWGILLADPWLAATPGFALSAAASGALILLARPLAGALVRWMPAPLALAVSVPLSAQLVCGPIIALFAAQQSLIGIAANLLAAPAAPLATVIGLLGCLAAPVPILADALTAGAWLPAAWIATTAAVTADLPLAQVPVVPGLASALLVLLLSAAVVLVLLAPERLPRIVRHLRVGAAAVLVVGVSLAGAQLLLSGPLAATTTPRDWAIAACDIGQGDALVVRSEGAVALIDTGPSPEPLSACLRSLGIERIDLLVLTHFDLDHVGGVDAVRGRVRTVLHGPVGESADRRMLDALAQDGADVVPAAAGMHGGLGGARWRVVWPRADSAAFPAGNDASLVVDVTGGGVPRSLFLGDLSATPQRMLLASGGLHGRYDVVKVAHHGSADQDPGLYEAVRPAVAIFSAGADNDYGHPRAETLDTLSAVGAHLLRTDLQGRILLGMRDGRIDVWTERRTTPGSGSGVGDPG